MRRGRCKEEILNALEGKYDKSVDKEYSGNFLNAVQDFDFLAENKLRIVLQDFYDNPRSRDQGWRSCKGSLYEYAVYKCIEQVIASDNKLNRKFMIVMGDEALTSHKNQIIIRNWSEIFPDVDILIIEKKTNRVKVIISCKTSLRERLTETAFWKRELERSNMKDIYLVFITTDKDNELRIDTNRYILLHVIDGTFVTDPKKYDELISSYKKKYGRRGDFQDLTSKIKSIAEIRGFLHALD